ncbi:MAG: InlB B-repeat-containing protein, partial [Spirochaetales bacterium]|nr:InlB B-repeat-containing protein [Spirochaetales bacterium]
MKNKIISLFLLLMLFSCSDLFDLYQLQNISITFNSNGGTGNMAEQSFTVGVSQKLSANIFTRSGYTFVGWNSSADGSGRSYSNEQTLTFSDETSLTLY